MYSAYRAAEVPSLIINTDVNEFLAMVDFLASQKLYRTLERVAQEAMNHHIPQLDPHARFWRAFALSSAGNRTEAIRLLNSVRTNPDFALAAGTMLVQLQRGATKGPEADALNQLKEELKTLTKTSTDEGFIVTSRYFLHSDRVKHSKHCIDKVLERSPNSYAAQTMGGLVYLAMGNQRSERRAAQLFDEAASQLEQITTATRRPTRDLITLMGRAAAYEALGDFNKAYEDLNTIVVVWPSFYPGLLAKARLLAREGKWDEAVGTIGRILAKDATNVSALQLASIYSLVSSSNLSTSLSNFQALLAAIDEQEANNHALFASVARTILHWCGRRPELLHVASTFASRASAIDASSSAYMTDQANILMQLNEFKRAAEAFKDATQLDENNVDALYGRIRCRIAAGEFKEAALELEFLKEIQPPELFELGIGEGEDGDAAAAGGSPGVSASSEAAKLSAINPELQYLNALVSWKKREDATAKEQLAQALSTLPGKLAKGARKAGSPEFYTQLNAQLYIDCAFTLASLFGPQPAASADEEPPATAVTGITAMEQLLHVFPGSATSLTQLARLQFVAGQLGAAEVSISAALKLGDSDAQAYLASAWIAYYRAVSPRGQGHQISDQTSLLSMMMPSFEASKTSTSAPSASLAASGDFSSSVLSSGNDLYSMAWQQLDRARSLDFDLRNSLSFLLLRSRLLDATGSSEEALKVINTGLSLPGVKPGSSSSTNAASVFPSTSTSPSGVASGGIAAGVGQALPTSLFSPAERLMFIVDAAQLFHKLGKLGEATALMRGASAEFKSPAEQHALALAEADVYIKRRDPDAALRVLQSISPQSPLFVRAKMRAAEVHLTLRKSKKDFLACYQQLATHTNSSRALVALGDACFRVQEPAMAIEAFEAALAKDSSDAMLSIRIGEAMLRAHDYARAVAYYESALKTNPEHVELALRLAQLYLRIKAYDEAIRVLTTLLEHRKAALESTSAAGGAQAVVVDASSLSHYQADVRIKVLLATVLVKSGKPVASAEAELVSAAQLQDRIVAATRVGEQRLRQLEVAAEIQTLLGELYRDKFRDSSRARTSFEQALNLCKTHARARGALTQLLLEENEIDACVALCQAHLETDPNDMDTIRMLAELKFKSSDSATALQLMTKVLNHDPSNYETLARLITLLYRAGKLSEAEAPLQRCRQMHGSGSTTSSSSSSAPANGSSQSSGTSEPPGLSYCRGLYAWYSSQPREALECFNRARSAPGWGRAAVKRMIEVYLNPHNRGILFSVLEGEETPHSDVIASVERLLKELVILGERGDEYVILEAYVDIATRLPQRVEKGLSLLMNLLKDDRDHVAANVAVAMALIPLQQQTKARNQLKRVAKLKVPPHHVDAYERGMMLLAEMYIRGGKPELATELCNQVLRSNKSCSRAYELLAQTYEESREPILAAHNYKLAWKAVNMTDPAIGYKLAFNYLKSNQPLEAVETCHTVLNAYPDYPKIRKDILAPARALLRR